VHRRDRRSGIKRVIVGTIDPDSRVAGQGVEVLRRRASTSRWASRKSVVRAQLAAYLWQRVTGRPYVVAKVASTLDGVVAMADGTSQWITGEAARRDAHVVRAQSQAIIVGAGTVRSDDPA
jgi:diaminohydroxyphosphoribosylaminopyrimidine deaminase / 5-amino-6-(5-phosphoribosylamino)uracil reductase